jgi:hypothetical protein
MAGLAGCSARTLQQESSDAATGTVQEAGALTSDSGPPTGTSRDAAAPSVANPGPFVVGDASGAELFTPQRVAAALATCGLPHGPAVTLSTVGEKRAQLVGSWFFCPVTGGPETAYSDPDRSMAFTSDGQWYNLLLDPDGGLVHGYGVVNQGTYSIGEESDASDDASLNGSPNVYIQLAAGGINGDAISFETSPSRMFVVIGTAGTEEWFVSLGP